MRKFSDEEIRTLEVEYRAGVKSVNAIAKEFDVPEATLRRLIKKSGWVRGAPERKRQIVAEHFAGVTNGLTSDEVRQNQESAAQEDIADMQSGLVVARACIRRLGEMVEAADSPRDIKVIVEANKGAIETIRKIRGLDDKDLIDDFAKKVGEGAAMSALDAYSQMCGD